MHVTKYYNEYIKHLINYSTTFYPQCFICVGTQGNNA